MLNSFGQGGTHRPDGIPENQGKSAEILRWARKVRVLPPSERSAELSLATLSLPAVFLALCRAAGGELFKSPLEARVWLDLAQEILEKLQRDPHPMEERDLAWFKARLLNVRAACFMVVGELQSAHKSYVNALDVYRRLGDEISEAKIIRGLQFTLTQMGRQAEARSLALPALAIFRRWSLRDDRLALMNNLGLVAFSMGNPDRAELIFSRLLEKVAPGHDLYGPIFHNVILIKMEKGLVKEALAELAGFMEMNRRTGNRMEEACGGIMTGECLILLKAPAEALGILSSAGEAMDSLGYKFDAALINVYMARCHVDMGGPERSLPFLRRASDFFMREGYTTELRKLMDLWMTAQAAASDVKPLAEKTFVFARNYWKCLPPIGATASGF